MWNGVLSSGLCDPYRKKPQWFRNIKSQCRRFGWLSKTNLFSLIIFSINFFDNWGDYSVSSLFWSFFPKWHLKAERCISGWELSVSSNGWNKIVPIGASRKLGPHGTRNLVPNPPKLPVECRHLGFSEVICYSQTFSNDCKTSRSQPQNSTLIILWPQWPQKRPFLTFQK